LVRLPPMGADLRLQVCLLTLDPLVHSLSDKRHKCFHTLMVPLLCRGMGPNIKIVFSSLKVKSFIQSLRWNVL